jgi:hypothetical protein
MIAEHIQSEHTGVAVVLNCSKYDRLWLFFSKGKVHSGTGHEGPEGGQRYSSTHSLTSALYEGR